MQKAPNLKYPGDPGHKGKTIHKDNRYRRKGKFYLKEPINIFNKIIENFSNIK